MDKAPSERLALQFSGEIAETIELDPPNRRYLCEVIVQCGRLLRLPAVTTATAQVLLHRYFESCERHQLAVANSCSYSQESILLATLLIATKVEETRRKASQILTVFDRVLQLRAGIKSRIILDTSSQVSEAN